jgi:two-component system response regulator
MSRKPFILFAEDDSDDKFLLQTVFEEKGYNIQLQFVSNGVELMSYLEEVKLKKNSLAYPDLILLDLNMPKMDGKEALKKIKEESAYDNIEIAVFSTTKNEKEIKRCYELGANLYIIKPSTYDSFLETIDTISNYCSRLLDGPNDTISK